MTFPALSRTHSPRCTYKISFGFPLFVLSSPLKSTEKLLKCNKEPFLVCDTFLHTLKNTQCLKILSKNAVIVYKQVLFSRENANYPSFFLVKCIELGSLRSHSDSFGLISEQCEKEKFFRNVYFHNFH